MDSSSIKSACAARAISPYTCYILVFACEAAEQRGDVAGEAEKDFDALISAHTAMVASLAKETHPNRAAESYAAIEEQQVKAMLLLDRGEKAHQLRSCRKRPNKRAPFRSSLASPLFQSRARSLWRNCSLS